MEIMKQMDYNVISWRGGNDLNNFKINIKGQVNTISMPDYKVETIKVCDTDVYLCVPFVAVLIRLADIVDFGSKRTPQILFSHLAVKKSVALAE